MFGTIRRHADGTATKIPGRALCQAVATLAALVAFSSRIHAAAVARRRQSSHHAWDNRWVTDAELLRRLDRTIERNSEVIDLNARAFERLVRSHARLERTVGDLRDQIATNTEAVLRLIDRLGPAPGAGT
jgi:hypothetical protein